MSKNDQALVEKESANGGDGGASYPGMDSYGGFGFEDPDGNLLSATNVTH